AAGRAEQVVPRRAERRLIDLRRRVVGRDLAREDREHHEDEQQEYAHHRLTVAADRAPDVPQAALLGLRDERRRPYRWRRKLVGRAENGCAHLTSRVLGSSTAVAASAARIAVSTATTIIRNRPCMSA